MTDSRQDTSGWSNICTRPVGPGVVCGLPYWYLAKSQKRLTPDLAEAHVCRTPATASAPDLTFGGVW
jgi:hypothetical protein